MKILIVTSDYLPHIGGIATHIYELSRNLCKLGHEITIFYIDRNCKNIETKKDGNILIYNIPYSDRRKHFYYRKIIKFIYDIKLLEGKDIIHVHTLYPDFKIINKINTKAPIVFTNHSSGFLKMITKLYNIPRLQILLRKVDYIITPSIELAEKSALVKSKDKIKYISNGVDTSYFLPSELDRDKNNFYVFCPRRIVEKNGIFTLICAIPTITRKELNIRFLFCSKLNLEDEYHKKIINFIESHNIRKYITFLGDLPLEKMKEYYQKSHLVVIPSFMEANSIACLEAMACESVVIASGVGGLSTLIENEKNGYLVPPGDSEVLANKIIKVIQHYDNIHCIRKTARDSVIKNYSWDIITRNTVDIYKKVIR